MDREPDIIFPDNPMHYQTAIWVEENIVHIGYPKSGIPKPLESMMVRIEGCILSDMPNILNFIHASVESDYALQCQDAINQYILKRDLDNVLKGE